MKHLLFLLLLFLLSSCAVIPTTEQNKLISKDATSVQEARLSRDQALQQLNATRPEAYVLYEQARVAESKGNLDIAIEIYHKAMQIVPENGLLLTGLGMAYLRKEDIVPARRYLLKAVKFDPLNYKPRLGLGYIYLQNQQLRKAILQLETSLQLLPTLEGKFLLGEAMELQGNLPRARQLYQDVVHTDKNSKLGKEAASRLRSF